MDGEETTTLRRLWAETATVLDDRHAARWICEVAASVDGEEFLAELDLPVSERVVAHHDAMVARYRAGEPLAYVLGRWSFRHLDLAVDKRVLIPRPETELVAEVAIALARQVEGLRTVVDLGTGSGAIGLSLAHELPLEDTTVWITDASQGALDVATANLVGIGRAARNVQAALGSWWNALPTDVIVDVAVSNPPYVAIGSPDLSDSVKDWEPALALYGGPDGFEDLHTIISGGRDRIKPGGWLVLEIGSAQGDAMRDLLMEAGYDDVDIRQDYAGHDRIALGQAPA